MEKLTSSSTTKKASEKARQLAAVYRFILSLDVHNSGDSEQECTGNEQCSTEPKDCSAGSETDTKIQTTKGILDNED